MKKIMCSSTYAGCEHPNAQRGMEEATPLIHYAPHSNAMLTLRGDSSDMAEHEEARVDTASARIRYVSQVALEVVILKVNKGAEISREEVSRMGPPDRLPDEAVLVPLDFGAGGCDTLEEMLRKHGPAALPRPMLLRATAPRSCILGRSSQRRSTEPSPPKQTASSNLW